MSKGIVTRELLKEVKKCDTIVFRTTEEDGTSKSTIECTTEPKNNYSEFVYTFELEKSCSAKKGFYMCHTSRFDNSIQTIFSCLKVGDTIKLSWQRDAMTNGYMEKHDLHGDALYLIVNRGEGKNSKRLEFLVATSCCEDNSARMIDYK
jgi:hypothetical protein